MFDTILNLITEKFAQQEPKLGAKLDQLKQSITVEVTTIINQKFNELVKKFREKIEECNTTITNANNEITRLKEEVVNLTRRQDEQQDRR